ncbi:hypothetical protein BDZ45DRAFT_730509 [Acephala macrosclerotiorum]|nr:hypothetical protein BDZ45DRAFT_730509 [Acephala macrosclerotiorum]
MAPNIFEIVRVIAVIRSSALPIRNLDDFIRRHVRECRKHRQSGSKDAYFPASLSKTTTTVILRGVLATAKRKACFALACLKDSRRHAWPSNPSALPLLNASGDSLMSVDIAMIPLIIMIMTIQKMISGIPGCYLLRRRDHRERVTFHGTQDHLLGWRSNVLLDILGGSSFTIFDMPRGNHDWIGRLKAWDRLRNMDPMTFYDNLDRLGHHLGHSEIYEITSESCYAHEIQSVDQEETLFNKSPYQMSPLDDVLEVTKYVWNSKLCDEKICRAGKRMPLYWRHYVNPGESRGSMLFSELKSSEYSQLRGISFDHFRRLGAAFWQLVGLSLLHLNGTSRNGADVSLFTQRD